MSPRLKVTVAGAGALGLTAALALARAGARVVVFDPAPLGENASGIAAGMLAPAMEAALDALAAPQAALLRTARDAWPALARDAGVALDAAGAMAVGSAERLDALAARFERLGFAAERLSAAQAAALAPGLAAPAAGALYTGEDWRLEPRQALAALRDVAARAGAAFRAAPFDPSEPADWRLAATGADALDLAPELSLLTPIKGHILRAPELAYAGAVVRGEGVYVAPGDGGMVVGATMEAGVRDRRVDPDQVARLREAGAQLFPALAGAAVATAAGLRATTPDGLPLAGASGAPGVLVAAGARRNGWLLAPLVAEAVVRAAFGEPPPPWAGALAPGRFAAPG